MEKLFTIEQIRKACQKISGFEDGDHIQIMQVSKGKMNHVYKVYNKASQKTIVFKQAGDHPIGFEHANVVLPLQRNINEFLALNYMNAINPTYAPIVLDCNAEYHYFFMEYVEGYIDFRDLLLMAKIPCGSGKMIARILVDTLHGSTEYCKTNNDTCMKMILEAILFELPVSGQYICMNEWIVDKNDFIQILNDQRLTSHYRILNRKLFEKREMLVHGDLHAGSICFNDSSCMFYDYEFAYAGPFGYDAGKILAHMLLGACHLSANGNFSALKELLYEISQFYDSLKENGITTECLL